MKYIILEYERDREIVVCRNMTRLDIKYYHPVELRETRPNRRGPKVKSILTEHPALNVWGITGKPCSIIFLMGGIETARKAMTTQYTEHIWADVFEKPLEVPDHQIDRFRETMADWNETIRKRWERGQVTGSDERKKFVRMTLESLLTVKERYFGKADAT